MRGKSALVFALLLVLSACRDEPGDAYLRMTGKVFIFNYRFAVATYVLTFEKVKPVPDGTILTGEFENPAGGPPLLVTARTWPLNPKIALESPDLQCVRKGKPYAIAITLRGPDGQVLQRIDTTLTSTLDQSVLPDKPLVVGPVYTPNPELAGHPDGHLGGIGMRDCPK